MSAGKLSLLIILLPFGGALVVWLFRKIFSRNLIVAVTLFFVFCSFACSTFLLTTYVENSNNPLYRWEFVVHRWKYVEGAEFIPFIIKIDGLSISMSILVLVVAFFIIMYSKEYISKEEDGFARFFSLMSLFISFMLVIVMTSERSPVMTFIGWEGVGLCSYLLIGYWFKVTNYAEAGRKAFIITRLGDWGFLMGVVILTFLNISGGGEKDVWLMRVVALCILCGVIGKSAQFPLHTWLRDAMAGPTPVSALIHAATMVAAGVYIVCRYNYIFEISGVGENVVLPIGLLTCFLGGIVALTQTEIKRTLAYSTISQLGLMCAIVGAGGYSEGMFHLTTHAFFKALLFLCAGCVIHYFGGVQDITKMGGLLKKTPLVGVCFLVGCLSMSGVPPFGGFFSKEAILEKLWTEGKTIEFVLVLIASLITVAYSFRLFFIVFGGRCRTAVTEEKCSPLKISMKIPLIVLSIFACFSGFLGGFKALGLANIFKDFLNINTETLHHNTMPIWLSLLTVILVLGVIILMWFIYGKGLEMAERLRRYILFVYKLSHNRFYIDEFYSYVIVKPFNYLSEKFYHYFDVGVVDKTIGKIGRGGLSLGEEIMRAQSGVLRDYLYAIVLGVLLLLIYFFCIRF